VGKEMKILIFGAQGYLGQKFDNYFYSQGIETFAVKHIITNKQEIDCYISQYKPDFVLNCCGKTGSPNVDWCETHKEETFFSNVILPAMMAKSCSDYSTKMVHIGSGCIYEGDNEGKGFSEDDKPNFDGSFYSWTKAVSERYLSSFSILQIRIRMPIDDIPNPRNLLTKLLNYSKIIDINNSITYIPFLMRTTQKLIMYGHTGIFNVVNEGPVLHSEILSAYSRISGVKSNFEIISLPELERMVKARRSNCVLSTNKLKSAGIEVPTSSSAIELCAANYIAAERNAK